MLAQGFCAVLTSNSLYHRPLLKNKLRMSRKRIKYIWGTGFLKEMQDLVPDYIKIAFFCYILFVNGNNANLEMVYIKQTLYNDNEKM